MTSYPYILSDNSLTIYIDGNPYTIHSTVKEYTDVLNAIKTEKFDTIKDIISKANKINKFGDDKILVKNGVVSYNGEELHGTIINRIIKMSDEGFNINPMVAFLENLMLNVSEDSINELYDFIESGNMPITENGTFLAYKIVGSDYKDLYTHTIDNSIGQKPYMDRDKVDSNRNNTCSDGLHFCSKKYLPHYGNHDTGTDRVMVLEINPKDVVSIPKDYHNAKGRAYTYKVVGELDTTTKDFNLEKTSVNNEYIETGSKVDNDNIIKKPKKEIKVKSNKSKKKKSKSNLVITDLEATQLKKKCKVCNKNKYYSEFYKDTTRSKDGYRSTCKSCMKKNK